MPYKKNHLFTEQSIAGKLHEHDYMVAHLPAERKDIMQINKENFIFTLISRKFTPKMPDDTVLSKHNSTHKAWFDKLYDDLFRIWEYEKAGSAVAHEYMHSSRQADLVNLHLWFNMGDKYYNQFVTYAEYKRVRVDMDDCLRDIKRENRKKRFYVGAKKNKESEKNENRGKNYQISAADQERIKSGKSV